MVSGKETDELEKWLDKSFESPAGPVLDKVVGDHKLSRNDWRILINFLAAQDVRTPSRLFEHLILAKKMLKEALDEILNDLPEGIGESEVSEIENRKNIGSELFPLKISTKIKKGAKKGILKAETYAGRSTWLYSIRHILNNTSKVLHGYRWTIIKPAKGMYWPTSDNPVVRLNYYSKGNYDLKGGWGVKKGNIIFPVGPEHAMFVQIGDKPYPKGSRLTVSQTNEIQKIILDNAFRKIFSIEACDRIPVMRERVVNAEKFQQEMAQMEKWHQLNAEMELDYIASNKKD